MLRLFGFVVVLAGLGGLAAAAAATALPRTPAPPAVGVVRVVSPPDMNEGPLPTTAAPTGLPLQANAAPGTPTAAAAQAPAPGPTPLTPLPGCPPPPSTPGPYVPPWHPDHLVPDAALPAPQPPSGTAAPLTAITGKGLWVWQYHATEAGNAQAIADRAVRAGLAQVWVRVADSRDGFYGADELAAIVPAAHARGLSVIAWGFPYLYDPAGDAAWTQAVLAWRSPHGEQVDGFSADIETASEGVALSAPRAALYLSLVRSARDGRPLIATVYPPTDHWLRAYPYAAMAPFVDAFAPMVYWECRDPGAAADEAVSRLAAMKPVHAIGQAFSFGEVGGRVVQPTKAELDRFMGVARRDGAVGASFWVWQDVSGEEWNALSAYPWAATEPNPERPLTALGAPR